PPRLLKMLRKEDRQMAITWRRCVANPNFLSTTGTTIGPFWDITAAGDLSKVSDSDCCFAAALFPPVLTARLKLKYRMLRNKVIEAVKNQKIRFISKGPSKLSRRVLRSSGDQVVVMLSRMVTTPTGSIILPSACCCKGPKRITAMR